LIFSLSNFLTASSDGRLVLLASPEDDAENTMTDSESPDTSPDPSAESASNESSTGSTLVSGGELSDEGKREVARWVNDGLGLSEVQKRLANDHGLTLTYMETRFLVDDLDLDLQDPAEPEPSSQGDGADADSPAPSQEDAAVSDDPASTDSSGVAVDVDKVMRPGALASGSVTFPDGVTTQWQLDQFGRLALTPKDDYKPSEENLMAFQEQLQVELQKAGF
jgi:hypothetical protein